MLQAELERHELMLAAVLRGKARFGRHRRNLQAQLAQQNQAVEMLENAMSAVAARVALLAPCARGPSAHGKTEVFGKTEELVFSKTEELSTDAVAPEACAAGHKSRTLVTSGSARPLLARAAPGAARWTMMPASGDWAVSKMEDGGQAVSCRPVAKDAALQAPPWRGSSAASGSNSEPLPARPVHLHHGQETRVPVNKCSPEAGVGHCLPSPARPASTSPGMRTRGLDGARVGDGGKNTRTIASIRRLREGGDGSWYYSEHSVYSQHAGVEEDALLQLVEACDDAERMLLAHHGAERRGQAPSDVCHSAYSLVQSAGDVHGLTDMHRMANKQVLRDKGRARSREQREGRHERACGQNGTGKGAAGGGKKAGGRLLPAPPAHSEHMAETRALKSIQNLVVGLGKTVSNVEKQQRATSAQVHHLGAMRAHRSDARPPHSRLHAARTCQPQHARASALDLDCQPRCLAAREGLT